VTLLNDFILSTTTRTIVHHIHIKNQSNKNIEKKEEILFENFSNQTKINLNENILQQ